MQRAARTPKNILVEINKSFSLVFCDLNSSANHLRIAIESILTHLKVKRYNKSGKRIPISLSKRIGKLPQKYEHLKQYFHAIKWLGNAGSHSGELLSVENIEEAHKMLIRILSGLFESKIDETEKIARRINKRRGPVKQ